MTKLNENSLTTISNNKYFYVSGNERKKVRDRKKEKVFKAARGIPRPFAWGFQPRTHKQMTPF